METQHRHPSEKPLPPISVYVYVGLILAILTAVEVAAFYLDVSGSVLVPIFIILSLFKFVLVVMFFMHLKYEANWKYVLTIPAGMMSIFLVLMLVPDVGMRMRHYSVERHARRAAEAVKKDDHGKSHGHDGKTHQDAP